MRVNIPVTNVEYDLREGISIVSKTDIKGIITYANPDFIEASGYTETELIGQPQNLLRHPDMPAWAFADLWQTISKGHPWRGIVKNRRKNGDYYWVRANVSPISENGRVAGYLSVRSKPTRSEVSSADALYRSGVTPKTNPSLMKRFKNLSLGMKLQVLIQSVIFILMIVSTYFIAQYVKEIMIDSVQQRAQGVANEVIDSANMLMVTGQISDVDNRKLLFKKISETGNIVSLKLVRAEQVVKQFGEGLPEEHVQDGLESQAIASKQAHYGVEYGDKPLFRAVTPYIVSHNFHGTDCLRCHQVEVGSVNGASDIVIDISGDMARYKTMLIALIAGQILLQVILFVFIRSVMHRFVTRPVKDIQSHIADLSDAKMSANIDIAGRDEMGEVLCSVQSAQLLLGSMISETRQLADSTMRNQIALDNVGTGVMIADKDCNIIFMNKSVVKLLSGAEADIRKELPNFTVSSLMGVNIDLFHKNPAHQRQLLATLNKTHNAEITVAGYTFALTACPVINEHGERLGAAIEWRDRTAEVAVENEISDLVNAAANGDFTRRISLKDKDGFFKQLGLGMNNLMETSATGLDEVVRVLAALAKGDLTESITNEYHGTFGQLKDDSNSTVAQLTEVITQIKESADTINTAAREISSGNTNLSQRTEEQASSLEETAASMEELTSTVKQNSESARQANQLAAGASEIAMRGGDVVGKVVETMSSISESSKKIVDIISVIDGIAFQTNILALNAAVEAARAGEQGRGFAVVASEVRNLAQRSATAAKEIKTLIGDSVDKVKAGTELADKAGKTMDEVVNSVKRVTNIMAEISAASIEQSSGIEQVNQAITQMDDVTQQNAALVEEAAAAAESMEEQAQQLTTLISTFKLANAMRSDGVSVAVSRAGKPKIFSFNDAINAHIKWKSRLMDYIKGKSTEELEVAKVSCDDQCDLGRWLYGSAKHHARLPEYRELKNSHAAFHRSVGDIVQCVHDHQIDQAMDRVGGEFFQLSNQTVRAIKSLKNRVEGGEHSALPTLSATDASRRTTGNQMRKTSKVNEEDWKEF